MSASILLNLLSKLGEKIRCEALIGFHQRALIKIEMQDFTYYVCMYVTKIAFYEQSSSERGDCAI